MELARELVRGLSKNLGVLFNVDCLLVDITTVFTIEVGLELEPPFAGKAA